MYYLNPPLRCPQALMAVCLKQELLYDFETFQHPVPVDLPVIVLTDGRWGCGARAAFDNFHACT